LVAATLPGLVILTTLLLPSPPTAAADPYPVTELERAYTSARHLPPGSVAGVRPGSLHTLDLKGTTWAIADFVPAAADTADVRARFQDGAGTGVFTRTRGRRWQLVHIGPYGCAEGLPAAARAAWHLPRPAECLATPAAQRSAAESAGARAGAPHTLVQRIVHLALSQVGVGVNPPSNAFSLDCNPYSTMVGASSANTIGCGYNAGFSVQNQNEPWCSDFTKWVWQHAGVTADMGMINAGANSFYAWGRKQYGAIPIGKGTPAVGDAVVFFPPGPVTSTSFADHVGTIVGINHDGTVNMVNGDFQGATTIATQYDTNINLATWPAQNWGPGEQWMLIPPPGTKQQPAPVAHIDAPSVGVTGTTLPMHAAASVSAGTITRYDWTFGDGRTSNTTGPDVTHAYPNAGIYPVTMTATSNLGTVTIRTHTVRVAATSAALTATPDNAVWYLTTPVIQDLYLPPAMVDAGLLGIPPFGVLRSRRWDGTRWLPLILPGRATPNAPITAVTYPDPHVNYVMAQHVYYRDDTGRLAQTYATSAPTSANPTSVDMPTWATQTLAGFPAPDSALAAATTLYPGPNAVAPGVFYFDAGGQLRESAEYHGVWQETAVPFAATADRAALAVSVTPLGNTFATHVFFLDRHGQPRVATRVGGGVSSAGWRIAKIPTPYRVAAASPLAATSTADGRAALYFVDRAGNLDQATGSGSFWSVHRIPTAPVPSGRVAAVALAPASLLATNYRQPDGVAGVRVIYRTATGPALTSWDGSNWRVEPLPGPADAVLGASTYTAPGEPDRVFLANGSTFAVAERPAPGAAWTVTGLPNFP
jgi:PKD repeat protein